MSPRPVLPSGQHTRLALAGLGGLAALKAVALVLLMSALAHALAGWAGGTQPDLARLSIQGSLGALLLAGTVWGQKILARRAALGTKEELRARLMVHRLSGNGGVGGSSSEEGTGAEGMLASRGLDGLDNYFTAYLPALVTCAVLPLLIGLTILVTDWVSALIVALTIPLVPVFMILIGFHTQDRVHLAAQGLDRLSNHLLELARGLPVLVGLRRAGAQRQALADVSEKYRISTMATLRTAFLSAMALELISTISVALVAVFIGVRLVTGQFSLDAGLLALMLAPECFRPLRDIGAAHHGSEDGVEALRRVNEILEAGAGADDCPTTRSNVVATASGDPVGLAVHARAFTVMYPGRTEAALDSFTASVEPGGVLVLDGASGTGKSTALAAMAGLLGDVSGPTGNKAVDQGKIPRVLELTGSLRTPPRNAVIWIAQHPLFTEETVAKEVALYAGGPARIPVSPAVVQRALASVNALHLGGRAPLQCSPGELRRVAVARALARIAVDPAVELALFDEPTAHLDPVSARCVRVAIAALAGSLALVVATHDTLLAALLRGTGDHAALEAVAVGTSDVGEPDFCRPNLGTSDAVGAETLRANAATTNSADLPEGSIAPSFQWSWLRHLPLRSPRFIAGVLVAALATLSAAALAGISGWLIVWAASAPPIMYLMTLIVGVRTFGIARSVLRYSERLLTHDAVFRWAARLRLDLWDALGTDVRHWGKLTRSGGALGTLIADVDELRDALPRVVVPIPAAVLSYLGVLAATVLLVPPAATVVVILGVLAMVALPVIVYRAQRNSAAAAALHRSWLASRATTLLGAAEQLRANGVGAVQADAFAVSDSGVAAPLRRMAWANGLGQSAVSLLTSLAAVAVAAVCVGAGTDPRAAAVVALLMLALAEPLGQYIEAVEQLPVLSAMMARTMPLLDSATTVETSAFKPDDVPADARGLTITDVKVENITARYPGMRQQVFSGVSGSTMRGRWWTVSGPSGSGKSTLLAVLLGFLKPVQGSYTLNEKPPTLAALGRVAWCPQESYLFNSSLRANLALARPAVDAPQDDELERVIETVGLKTWYCGLPDGLSTRVGPGGHHLSGGQRTRLSVARTLVAGAGVVLLDEPTAHLGVDEAATLIVELRAALSQAAVVLVTHDPALASSGDSHLELGGGEAENDADAGLLRRPHRAGDGSIRAENSQIVSKW
ncbi:thiol reductant ABC exporter subunit CydC [Arthrobacter cryoconiti]|uniref:Thiol reductant ABC exporter subunit CydC n=1 Tax=Arthrobacter cryoconiti TaxID=748907 RepID=A0ABV8R1X6_9MICC|nr:thiol reductant ABC exporter subunit CydC [Arthrobacter cryoconiti]MCC9069057.1 thiol reductant ABC exporter subunit CydC [Arthrobacter cryoconiti]